MNLNFEQDNNYGIVAFIKDLLEKRFPDNHRKQEINDEDSDKLNFACPYCGDSMKDSSKKRGNVYFKSNSFKCFNDGCLTWVPLNKFVAKFAADYSLQIPNIQDATLTDHKEVNIASKRGELLEFLMNPKVKNALIDFGDIYSRFFLHPCKDAPKDSPIGEYIDRRNLRNAPGFEQSCYYDNRQDKIYIFNIDLRSGKVLGLSIRMIENGNGPRYNVKNYSEFIKNKLICAIDKDVLLKIDTINNFFNILNIRFNQPIVITEGQINAMFIRNSIATTGVTKSKNILGTLVSKKNAYILFDNDKAGKKESMKLLEQGYKVFLWSKLIYDLKRRFPLQLRKISKINDINDLYSFYVEIGEEMTIDEFNDDIMKYFSDSIFDLLSV